MKNLKEKLEYYYKYFNQSKIESDPVQFPHRFSEPEDIEVMAFISSIFAYGKIDQILSTLEEFLAISENQPYEFILNFNKKIKLKLHHRFYSTDDIKNSFAILKIILIKHKSVKNLFLSGYSEKHSNVKQAISVFSKNILRLYEEHSLVINHAVKFMFPLPEKGSACKRMNLFLRWMVRKDKIDFGLWQEIEKKKLIIPVDTHIAKISKQLKLTNRNNVSWKMAEEITDSLKRFNENDPVKYDFSLCHLGINKMEFSLKNDYRIRN